MNREQEQQGMGKKAVKSVKPMKPSATAKTEWTATEIAAERGCDRSTVIRRANQAGFGRKIGNLLVFTEWEKLALIDEIQDGPGNPQMGSGQPVSYGRKQSGRNK